LNDSPDASDAEELSDRQLVTAFLAHRTESVFRALYRRHTPVLYRVALRLVGGVQAEAEDVVQETWVRALESLARFRGDARLSSWLVAIALNCVREAARRSSRDGGALDNEPPEAVPEPPPFDSASVTALERAIAQLPRRYREVIVLHDIEEHTHAEVARLLDIEVGTSKSQLARARRALRARLSPRARESRS
jgi:RNA polymerase sigma-70 factor (ECF subfamily)